MNQKVLDNNLEVRVIKHYHVTCENGKDTYYRGYVNLKNVLYS